jgi:thioredoxin reductase (NADPH)
MLGAEPNSKLARSLDAELSPEGYITVDTEARTSIPGLYAAGDVTRLFSHQIVTAAHEGATAAMAVSFDLYAQENGSPARRSRG